jgi:hypothetical protein
MSSLAPGITVLRSNASMYQSSVGSARMCRTISTSSARVMSGNRTGGGVHHAVDPTGT